MSQSNPRLNRQLVARCNVTELALNVPPVMAMSWPSPALLGWLSVPKVTEPEDSLKALITELKLDAPEAMTVPPSTK